MNWNKRPSRLILPEDFHNQRLQAVEPPDINTFIHQRVKIALQRGRIPWKVPVSHDPNCGLPTNVRTGGRYRGVNTVLLCDTYETHGNRSKWWGTVEDWRAIRADVKDDQEPTVIAHYRENTGLQVDPCLVFNAAQVHGAERYLAMPDTVLVANDEADFGLIGMLIEHHNPDIRFDVGDERFGPDWNGYITPEPFHNHPNHRTGDYILMQSEGKFHSRADHYSVMLHEMVHWSEVRTNWMHCMPIRELVAEIGMHILGLELGIPHFFDEYNHRKWLKEWNPIFHKDETVFLWAMAQVDRVCDFLLQPILQAAERVYHDRCQIWPKVNHITGPDFMSFNPRPLPETVQRLCGDLEDCPLLLISHLKLVHDVAVDLVEGLRAKFPNLDFDHEAVCFGAASHDIGKVLQRNQNELFGPGRQHEADGEALLKERQIEPRLARFARTHGAWSKEELPLEDLLVALADCIWKGQRLEALEKQVIDKIAEQTGVESWEVFSELDALLEEIGSQGDERLAWQRANG